MVISIREARERFAVNTAFSEAPRMETIGILGDGQLGRLLSLAAGKRGYDTIILGPTPDSPAGLISKEQIVAAYDERKALDALAGKCKRITYEFENVPAGSVRYLEDRGAHVFPSSNILEMAQDRVREKAALEEHGIPVTKFAKVDNHMELQKALKEIGCPSVLKTTRDGYDGHGQIVIRNPDAAGNDFELHRNKKENNGKTFILEKMVDFQMEISVIVARNENGQTCTFPVAENEHRDNILHMTIVPARISPEAAQRAQEMAVRFAEEVRLVGLLCIEMFYTKDGKILGNEIAPRTHNSGHWSIHGSEVSQFDQQFRALLNERLEPVRYKPSAMINILGEGNGNFLSGQIKVRKMEGIGLCMYGKAEAKKGRKMGHVTASAGTIEEAIERAKIARNELRWER